MIMILTPSRAYPFRLDEWGRDDNRDVHVYDGGTTIATFDASAIEAVFQNLSDADLNELAESIDVGVANPVDPNNHTSDDTTTTTT